MRTIEVSLGSRSYPVHVGEGLLAQAAGLISLLSAGRVFIVGDRSVLPLWLGALASGLGELEAMVIEVAPGEGSKDLTVAGDIASSLASYGARRKDLLLTFGGGVASDLGGFVASIYHRGMPVVHIPTTLLGQVDAAIGGKTGINLPEGKNLVGTFHQPAAVIADVSTLATLPEREFRSGMAEVIKTALCFDQLLLETIQEKRTEILEREAKILEEVVARCVEIKAGVVAGDERDESGPRMILNYGHTLGHALEAMQHYQGLTHGEAIAIGMVFAAELSVEEGLLEREAAELHRKVLSDYGLPVSMDLAADEIMTYIRTDKKHGAELRWVLLRSMGDPITKEGVGLQSVERALERIRG